MIANIDSQDIYLIRERMASQKLQFTEATIHKDTVMSVIDTSVGKPCIAIFIERKEKNCCLKIIINE